MTFTGELGTARRSRWTSSPFQDQRSSVGVVSAVQRIAGGKND
jgi:hypothetical protein